VARFDRFVEESLDVLLSRLDETGVERLADHEPKRISFYWGGG
jgi:hypothetical protein